MGATDDAKTTFAAGRYLAREKAPYMRAMLLAFTPLEVPGLGTIGVTEHAQLILDWNFIAQVDAEEMAGLLVHECCHLLLKHGARAARHGRDRALDNKAADLAINHMVLDMGLKLPGGGPGVTPLHPLHGLYPEEFGWPRGLTTDEYYDRLRKLPKPPPQAGQGGQGGGGDESDDGSAGGEGEPDDENDQTGQGGKGTDADHDKPGTGKGFCGSCAGRKMPGEPDSKAPGARSKNEMHRVARQVAEAVREHAQSSQGRGTVPGFLQRWADELLTPAEIPWEKELAVVTRAAVAWRSMAVDHRYDAPSRRQAGIGYGPGKPILPRFRMPVPNVHVIFDTSGSMGHEELSEGGREVAGILKAVGAQVTFCTCDAAVTGVTKVRSLKDALARLSGGGGTDMGPAFAAMMAERPKPEVIVCLTDLWIGDPGPEPQGPKVIWVAVGKSAAAAADPPWGRVVRTKAAKRETK